MYKSLTLDVDQYRIESAKATTHWKWAEFNVIPSPHLELCYMLNTANGTGSTQTSNAQNLCTESVATLTGRPLDPLMTILLSEVSKVCSMYDPSLDLISIKYRYQFHIIDKADLLKRYSTVFSCRSDGSKRRPSKTRQVSEAEMVEEGFTYCRRQVLQVRHSISTRPPCTRLSE